MNLFSVLCICFGFVTMIIAPDPSCLYRIEGASYTCELKFAFIAPESITITIGGTHEPGKVDADVNAIKFDSAASEHILKSIFNRFKNIKTIRGELGAMESLNSEFFYDCDKLESFSLENNNIPKLGNSTFAACAALTEIDLSFGQLETLERGALNGIENLRILKLKNNVIKNFDLSVITSAPLINLEILDLSKNQIALFNNGVFSKAENIKEFYMSENKLTILEKINFEKLVKLTTIDVTKNSIDKVKRGFFATLTDLKVVKFAQNLCNDKDYTDFSSSDVDDFETCFVNAGAASIILSNVLLIICVIYKIM